MLISWSLVALKTAWSGYQFSLVLVVVVAEPVVVRLLSSLVAVPLAGAADIEAIVQRTGLSTHFSWSNVTATKCSPIPRKRPTPKMTLVAVPDLPKITSLTSPIFSLDSL